MLNEQIKQIAERLRGLRDVLELSVEDIALRTGVSPESVERFESGESDIPMSFICDVAQSCGVQPSEIISGDAPKMMSYFLTRYGKGVGMERSKAYKYLALAAGFKNAVFEPFEVSIEPGGKDITLNTHSGHEFNYVLEGRMMIQIGDKQMVMNQGDSIYFDASRPHGMKAMDGRKAVFLAIISK